MDSYWVDGLHYRLEVQANILVLRVINVDKIDTGDILYISGIKLSKQHSGWK
jgi:hypothetical protein